MKTIPKIATNIIACALVLSAATPAAFAQEATGSATAPAPKGVKKWEYLYMNEFSKGNKTYLKIDGQLVHWDEAMNFLGSKGWELVSVNKWDSGYSFYWFKREVITD